MRYRALTNAILVLLLVTACNLGSTEDDDSEPIDVTSTPAGQPTVTIDSPQSAAEFVVNEPLFVEATVTDTVGVTQVRLLANDQPVVTRGVDVSNSRFAELVLDYTPRTTGETTLTVIAFRGNVASDPAEVDVTIRDTQAQVTATAQPGDNTPIINPNDPNCRILVNTNLNFRTDPFVPDGNDNRIRVLAAGEVLPVAGRLSDNSWWQVRDSNNTNRTGWVSRGPTNSEYIALYDGTQTRCSSIPVIPVTVPVTNTPVPTQTPVPQATQTPIPTSTSTSTPVPGPNLTISGVFGGEDGVTIPQGESEVSVPFSVNIRNSGGPLNQQFSVLARVVNGPTYDVGTFGNLDANQLITAQVDIDFDTAGEVTVIFIVDSDDEIEETNESDNEQFRVITVTDGS